MHSYGHEILNSRTSWITCNSLIIRIYSQKDYELNAQNIELKDATRLKDTQLMDLMRNLWA